MIKNFNLKSSQQRRAFYLEEVLSEDKGENYADSLKIAAVNSVVPLLAKTNKLHLIDSRILEDVIVVGELKYNLNTYIIKNYSTIDLDLKDVLFNIASLLDLNDTAIFEFLSDPRYQNWRGQDFTSAWFHKVSENNVVKYLKYLNESSLTFVWKSILVAYQKGQKLDMSSEVNVEYFEDLICSEFKIVKPFWKWIENQVSDYEEAIVRRVPTLNALLLKIFTSDLFSYDYKKLIEEHYQRTDLSIFFQKGIVSSIMIKDSGLNQKEVEKLFNMYPLNRYNFFSSVHLLHLALKKDWLKEYLDMGFSLKNVTPKHEYGLGVNLYLIYCNLGESLTSSNLQALKIRVIRFLTEEYGVKVNEDVPLKTLISILESTIFDS